MEPEQTVKQIDSPDNPLIKSMAKIAASKAERDETGLYLMEGSRALDSLTRLSPESLRGLLLPLDWQNDALCALSVERLSGLAAKDRALGATVALASDRVLAKVSTLKSFRGPIALVAKPKPVPPPASGDVLALVRMQDPGNMGTALRIAQAAGIGRVVASEDCVDFYSPKTVRSAMGAHLGLRLWEKVDVASWLRSYKGPIWATLPNGAQSRDLYSVDLKPEGVWLIGNEGRGLSLADIPDRATPILIPMAPGAESLNAAIAAGVCLFEQRRQRLHCAA